MADGAHPVHQILAEPFFPARGRVAAWRVDQGNVFVRYPEIVEIIEEFEAQPAAHAQHFIGEAVAGHHDYLVAWFEGVANRRTVDWVLHGGDNGLPRILQDWKV